MEYRENGLGDLIIPAGSNENDKKLSLSAYPLQFMLCLLDTIEPVKRFTDGKNGRRVLTPKETLKSIDMKYNSWKCVLAITWDEALRECSDNFKDWEKQINDLPKWMDREIEKITNSKHIPGKSVWHHVWEEKYGKYRMQLVDLSLHQKTCPHAGGCKKWSLCNGKSYKNRNAYACGVELYIGEQPKKVGVDDKIVKDHRRFINCRPRGMQPYMDLELDYVFITPSEYEWRCTPTRNNTTLSRTQRSYMKGIKKTNRTTFRAFGLDPYGNVFEVDKRGRVAFYDHEVGQRILIPYVML